ncbi:restriction endonuclease subunit S [Vibrio alginolyticus]|uniref:restriction endonuclease subunit S n=1 Tax=Vibrio alginolyticus TaxID=663 RepID=UPI00375489B6
MVPNGWSNTCIDDNITFSGGAQPPREVFKFEPEEGYIRLIQIRDYKSDKFITYVPKKLAKKFCTADDVMIGRYGPPIFQILRGIEGAYNVALIKAIPKSGVDKEFMYYFLKRDPLLRVIESFSQRTSGQTGIEMDVLKAYPMHLPPLPEQRKIAQILSTWDRGIATTERLIDASKQQKKALMQQLLTGKKRLVDPETGKAFEGDWAYVQAGSIFATRSNKKHNSDLPILAITQDQGAVPRELIDYNVSVTQGSIAGYKVVEIGDFIISLRSFQGGIEYSKYKGICSPAYVILYPKIEISDDFYKYHLKSFSFIQAMKSRLEGIRDGKIISYKYFSEIKLPQPSLKEQEKIASVLTAADKEIELLEAKLLHLKQEKKALMQQLLTGKRRVKVDETEAA